MYNTDSDSLDTGAPDITITGNQRMASYGFDEAMAESRQAYDDARQKGIIPFDMEFEEFLELMRDSKRAPQQDLGIMAAAPGTYTQKRKQMMAYGGIAGLDGRKAYGIGSWFQDYIKDPIERSVRGVDQSVLDQESQARVDAETAMSGDPNYKPWYEKLLSTGGDQSVTGNTVADQYLNELITGDQYDVLNMFGLGATDTSGEDTGTLPFGLSNLGIGNISLKPYLKYKQTIRDPYKPQIPHPGYGGGMDREEQERVDREHAARQAAVAVVPGEYKQTERVNPLYPIAAGLGVGKYVSGLPKDKLPMDTTSMDPAAIAAAARGTDAEGAAAGLRFLPEQVTRAAQGGRIGYDDGGMTLQDDPFLQKQIEAAVLREENKYLNEGKIPPEFLGDRIRMRMFEGYKKNKMGPGFAEGGLMNLGGMEKDYRQEGGFVPIGGKEKADDVPARLSKNEFVFTADAVRNAGGGDIDKGAEIMENVMKHLEAGGEVSEDSQGLEGARGMFANAQQLQKRII